MKKAGIPEHTAKKYFYTTGKRDNIPPCNCLNHPFFISANNNTVLPLPEIGSGLFAIKEERDQEVINPNNKTGKNLALAYCAQDTFKPATGNHFSTIHLLVLTPEIRNNFPFTNSVYDTRISNKFQLH